MRDPSPPTQPLRTVEHMARTGAFVTLAPKGARSGFHAAHTTRACCDHDVSPMIADAVEESAAASAEESPNMSRMWNRTRNE